MQTNDAVTREVLRRASLLKARRLRLKKRLLSASCLAFAFLLAYLLSGRISMDVAVNAESYGSLVFVGDGGHYVLIGVIAFLLGIPVGLGVDALVRRIQQRRLDSYAQKWLEGRHTPDPEG